MLLLKSSSHFNKLILNKKSTTENSRKSDICNTYIHRASYAKHLRNKRLLENKRQHDLIIPKWLFKEEQTPIRKKVKKV